MNSKCKNRISLKNNNAGFTLVELIVVLLLMSILLGATLFAGLGWQDWSQFRHEEACAEDIFYAAQNQLTELDSSGALRRKVARPLMNSENEGDYKAAYLIPNFNSIVYKMDGNAEKTYNEETIWINTNKNKHPGKIVKLHADANDYTKYLNKELGDNEDTRILFDLITPYISDKSILNGAIIIEFSPDAGQVFSVSYSDRADSLVYGAGSVSGDKKSVSVMNRILQVREDNMLGYFSVDNLTYKVRGRGTVETDLRLKIESNELYSLVVEDNNGELKSGDVLSFNIYDGGKNGDNVVMSFTVNYDDIVFAGTKKAGLEAATENPAVIDAYFPSGSGVYAKNAEATKQFRVPVFAVGSEGTNSDIYLVLDAADVQAQTLAYSQSIYFKDGTSNNNEQIDTFVDMEEAFRNTYSFYRFGLSNDVNYIYADVKKVEYDIEGHLVAESDPVDSYSTDVNVLHRTLSVPKGECTAFASSTKEASGENVYEIENMRHFYNIRYETDYKTNPDKKNVFKVMNDLSWKDFVGKGSQSDVNYFVNSCDVSFDNIDRTIAGLDLQGSNYGVKGADTAEYSFPGFRKLDKNDKLTQEHKYGGQEKSFVISDLNITITGNIAYGVYGNDIRNSCKENDFSNTQGLDDPKKIDSEGSNAARAGKMPLGLFAENLGTIENITLNRHVVNGLQKIEDQVIYTCMVGGFAGNNLGTISDLTILSNTDSKNKQNWNSYKKDASKVNGRTDVGGIIGRQSFAVDVDKRDVTIKGLTNYANVTGLENIGGIVGRAYTRYIDGTNVPESEKTFTKYYSNTIYETTALTSYQGITQRYYNCHDGYDITDNYKSMTGESVVRNDKITIEDCHNRGIVSGDSIAYSDMIGTKLKTWRETDFSDETITACSFIGGIAGSAIDGMIIDDKNLKSGNSCLIKSKCTDFVKGTNAYIIIKKSDSYPTYETMDAAGIASVSNKSIYYDNFVGGLIGYSKLVAIENCNNKPSSQYDLDNDGVPNVYVFGNRYVGGLIGCSVATRFDKGDATVSLDGVAEKTYAATNYSNVFGRLYVGGIMGGNGIGDDDAETFDYRNPSLNEANSLSQIRDGNGIDVTHNILNTGVVLCLKNNINTFDPLIIKSNNTQKEDSKYSQGYSGYCGGIVGNNRMTINNCDNIQSEATKGYVMSLISGSATLYSKDMNGLNKHLSDYENANKKFGGNFVGGIAGYNMELGYIDYDDSSCYVDAIVYGQQYVGGGVGGTYNSSSDSSSLIQNIYFGKKNESSGSYIIGGDVVGGVAGRLESIVKNKKAIDKPFTVFGRYAVGGMLGTVTADATRDNISIDLSDDTDTVYVFGKGYTGGVVGYQSGKSMNINGATDADVDLDNIHIEGKFYTGGIAGRVGDISGFHKLEPVKNIKMGDKVSVTSRMFAGGIAGLYYYTKNGNNDFYNKKGQPYKLVDNLCDDSLITTYKNVVIDDIDDKAVYGKKGDASSTITFDDYGKTGEYTNKASVIADLFAGGLFGYLPDATLVTIKGFVNAGSIKVNSSINVTVDVNTESNASYSFIGGVVGRVPKGAKLVNCANISTGDNYSSKGDYIGGLTEVNAGVITGEVTDSSTDYLISNTSYEYTNQSVGAFAGVNGTTYPGCDGVIQYVQNRGNISSENGTASGIAAAENTTSKITNSINLGDITSTNSVAAGMVASPSGQDEVSLCRNYGKITGASKFGIAGGKVGTLTKNLECSGLNEADGGTPIATVDNDHHMNFYVYGTDSTLAGEWYQIDFSKYFDKGPGNPTYYEMLKINKGGPWWSMTTVYDTNAQNNDTYNLIHNNYNWLETGVYAHYGNDSEKFMQYSALVYAAYRTIRESQGISLGNRPDDLANFELFLKFYKYVYENGKIPDDLYSVGYVEDSLSCIVDTGNNSQGGSQNETKEFNDSISDDYLSVVWPNCPGWLNGGHITYAELYSYNNSGYPLYWTMENYRNGYQNETDPSYPAIHELAFASYGFNGNQAAFHSYMGKLFAYYLLEVRKSEPVANDEPDFVDYRQGFEAFVNEQIAKDTKDVTPDDPQPSGGEGGDPIVVNNHWPLQLNSTATGTTWKLTYRTSTGTWDTGMTNLTVNPISYPVTPSTRVTTYLDSGFDTKFVTMANSTVAVDYISE